MLLIDMILNGIKKKKIGFKLCKIYIYIFKTYLILMLSLSFINKSLTISAFSFLTAKYNGFL